MAKITLELDSYNLDDAIVKVIKEALLKHNGANLQEIADILGVSQRTLLRYKKKYNIIHLTNKAAKAIHLLESMGYKISKEEE